MNLSKSNSEHIKTRNQFACSIVDEIVEEKYLHLSDDDDTWLYKTKDQTDRSNCAGERLSFSNNCSALDFSYRHVDSRTYTRRKRCSSVQPGFSPWQNMITNTPQGFNSTQRSSLGLLSSPLYNKTPDSDLLQNILKYTPPGNYHPERDSLNSTDSDTMPPPRRYQLDLSCSTDLPHKTNTFNLTFDTLQNNLSNSNGALNETYSVNKDLQDSLERLSEITQPFGNIITPESSMCNSLTMAESSESLHDNKIDINNMTNLHKAILNSTYESENIAPSVNLNTTVNLDKPLKDFDSKKVNMISTQTPLYAQPPKLNGTINLSKSNAHSGSYKSPLNTSFPKPTSNSIFNKTVNNTFTRSVDALNGGIDDDQISSASDSSFSSCSNLPQSLGDLQNIARMQEESLEECTKTNSTPKTAPRAKSLVNGTEEQRISTPKSSRQVLKPNGKNGNSVSGIFFVEEQLSPIMKSEDGNLSDHSEKSSGSSLSTYSSSSHNNNNSKIIPHPISALTRNHRPEIATNKSITTASNISRPKAISRLRMPVTVSQLPSRIVRPPAQRPVNFQPPITASNIPRLPSRLPGPKNRRPIIPKQ